MRFTTSVAALAASVSLASAQTSTSCNPLDKTCPEDTGLPSSSFTSTFTNGKGAAASWSTADGTTINYGSNGAEFSIDAAKQAPTMETDFYIFFGRVDVKMQAAPGTGIVSSIVLESDDLDEIDWEFTGGDTTQVQTNFFGKGNTTTYDRSASFSVSSPQTTMHTYSLDWTSERLLYIIDGVTVRTIPYNDPLALGGKNYPQTPMKLKLGSWCGGCAGEPQGTIEWAGGKTTFQGAPYVMYVESVDIKNYNPAQSYKWTDHTGDWQSIQIIDDGKSSTPTGQASGTATLPASGNQTSAPTKSHPVSNVMGTGAVTTGKSWGNSTTTATGKSGHGIQTSIVMATTEVPGAQPTGTAPHAATSTVGGSGSPSASASSSTVPATGGAAVTGAAVSMTLFGVLFAVLFL